MDPYGSSDDEEMNDDELYGPSSFDQYADEEDEAIANVVSAVGMVVAHFAASSSAPTPTLTRQPIMRDRRGAHEMLIRHYFDPNGPQYNDEQFRIRFRMGRPLWLKIVADMEQNYPYFVQRPDAVGVPGFSALQKCTAAIRQLAYGAPADSYDEYLQMSERVVRESLINFAEGVVALYGPRYLRRPTPSDLEKIYEVHNRVHAFPGMIGSVDCMHWEWTMCPLGWRGGYSRGDKGVPTVLLQVVASYDTWVWAAFCGMQGSNNDINVFNHSPVFEDAISGLGPTAGFTVNGNTYPRGYYLGDGIYPEWAIFQKTFTTPINEKRAYYKKRQEAARKDVERCFGILKKKWHFIDNPSRLWDNHNMNTIMYASIILHNMILEDKGYAICQNYNPEEPSLDREYWRSVVPEETRIANIRYIKSRETHEAIKYDLVDHVWDNRATFREREPPNIDY